ncbi:hypothetical protein V1512DRAFT_247354 [Lipomyces arxii]|uniref:uncharacterized protein n=1 Tax=Lipomyces arxii TaxID=56418 RepID=UPI0034CFD0B1
MPAHHPPVLSADSQRVAVSGVNSAFEGESGAEYVGSAFGGFSEYFRNKKVKLQNLDAHIFGSDGGRGDRPAIFKGCIVHVNGYTKPSNIEIHKLVVLYGGVYYQYMDGKTSVTHIVASSLTPKKMVEFARYRIVKPEWITESIEAGRLLPWHDYRVIQNAESQMQLDTVRKSRHSSPDSTQPTTLDNSNTAPVTAPDIVPDTILDTAQDTEPITNTKAMTAEEYNAHLLSDPNVRKSTVLNPDFLKTYYGQSRLHHLSTWKADLKVKIQNKILSATGHGNKVDITAKQRIVFHVDFDCFFASIALRSHPHLVDKPVCVGHGGNQNSEVASCNYVARKFGVRNGMWMHRAKDLCPELQCLPYEFDAYEEASAHLYNTLIETGARKIEAVSIDEALLDMTNICWSENEDSYEKALQIAQGIRNRVFELTKCNVSVGIGANILQAKVAIKKAKPAGQYCIRPEDATRLICDLKVDDLPGVGYSIHGQLKDKLNISTVGEVLQVPKAKLQEVVGAKTGDKLCLYAQGLDNRQVGEVSIRKSVSAEVNWGVRFENKSQLDTFLCSLAGELCSRLAKLSLVGTNLTLKVYKRAANAPLEPAKYLGCGQCDAFSRSTSLSSATRDAELLTQQALMLNEKLGIEVCEIRGLGLQMTKLSSDVPSVTEFRDGKQQTISFHVKQTDYEKQDKTDKPEKPAEHDDLKKKTIKPVARFPSESSLDPDVLAELPPEIVAEIEAQYNTKPVESRPARMKFKSLKQNSHKPVLAKQTSTEDELQYLDIDESVLNELPSNIRAEILHLKQEHQAVPPRTTPARIKHSFTPRPVPTFQGQSQVPALRQLLHTWISCSVADHVGPDEDDVALLEKYLDRVVCEEKNLSKAVELVKWVRFVSESALNATIADAKGADAKNETKVGILFEWLDLFERLRSLVLKVSEKRGVFNVQFD